jgi:hypothetical protein
MSLVKGVHQFLEDYDALDLEENFIVVLGYFDIQMFVDRLVFRLFGDACRFRPMQT